jgi:aarF domain-containing kinase
MSMHVSPSQLECNVTHNAYAEWANEIPKELDFRVEASNTKRVQRNLAEMLPGRGVHSSLAIDVSLPDVVDELVTEKVLVLSFVDGFKIDNKALLEKWSVDRDALVRNVTRSFAHQIFVNGFYSGYIHLIYPYFNGNTLIVCIPPHIVTLILVISW